jgi:HSP20 family protein
MNELSLFDTLFGNDTYGFAFPELAETCNTPATFTMPKVDVKENKDSYVLDMDLPGKTEKDVELELKDNVLVISGHKEEAEKADDNAEKFLLRERRASGFTRRFTLPEDINEDAVNACFKNGVLTVTIGRKELTPTAKKIAIKVA